MKSGKKKPSGKSKPEVSIVMGSSSDHDTMVAAKNVLKEFGVPFEYQVASAHRTPSIVQELASTARERGVKVFIAGAGGAAHLAGVIAAHTTLPVIGVPITSTLDGLDSLLSTVQMPGGIPVATVAIGKAGAKNSALLAIEILATSNDKLAKKLADYRIAMTEKVLNAKLPK